MGAEAAKNALMLSPNIDELNSQLQKKRNQKLESAASFVRCHSNQMFHQEKISRSNGKHQIEIFLQSSTPCFLYLQSELQEAETKTRVIKETQNN